MSYAQIEKDADVAIVWLDQPGEKVNKLSVDMIDGFDAMLDTLENDHEVKAVVLISRKKDTFIAGADIEKFLEMTEPEQGEEMSRQGNKLLKRMADFPKPIVAAIHGAALGGGLEVALACKMRIATDDPKTVLGQPEVRLGLLPGGGGTQRLPKLIGMQKALDIMLTGKNIYPRLAKRMGLVDHLIHPYGLLQAAKTAALQLTEKNHRRKSKKSLPNKLLEGTLIGRRLIYKKAREMALKQTLGNYPAPMKIIECVEAGMEKGFEKGVETEAKNFGELLVTPQCRELITLLQGTLALKKNPHHEKVRPVARIGVLGAGLMGAGIAHVSVMKGMEVLLKDVSLDAIANGEKIIWHELDSRVKKKALSQFESDRILSRVTGVTDYERFAQADLVIEAVFEDLDLKRNVLQETEAHTRDDCIFASNTSSLPIAEIATASKRPETVIGMHYFSPVPKMPLLEIITTDKTADWVIATAIEVGIKQGKTVIVVGDGPGFYTTRILAPLLNEALIILNEGGAIEQIDKAMKQFGFPVGPITLMDEVGIDVSAHVTEILSPMFAQRGIETNNVAKQIVEAGYQGRKNGKGFYVYSDNSRKKTGKAKQVNLPIYQFFAGKNRREVSAIEIQNRLSLVMMNEAAYCLQEEILKSPRDGDLGAVLGLGFPPFRGGPFRYADRLGLKKVIAMLEELESKHGPRFRPAQILKDYAVGDKRFYEGR